MAAFHQACCSWQQRWPARIPLECWPTITVQQGPVEQSRVHLSGVLIDWFDWLSHFNWSPRDPAVVTWQTFGNHNLNTQTLSRVIEVILLVLKFEKSIWSHTQMVLYTGVFLRVLSVEKSVDCWANQPVLDDLLSSQPVLAQKSIGFSTKAKVGRSAV